jgi:phosphoribosylformylglycinamidine synthase
MRAGLVRAAHDLSEGGLAVALAEMAFAGEVGAQVSLEGVARSSDADDDRTVLFSESGGRLLVAVTPEDALAFEEHLSGSAFAAIGETIADPLLHVTGLSGHVLLEEPLAALKDAWRSPLFELFDAEASTPASERGA